MAYSAGSHHPVDRLRAAVRDTGATALLTDAEYLRCIESSPSTEFIAVRYDEGNLDGVTSATARVNVSGTPLVAGGLAPDLDLVLATNLGTVTRPIAVGGTGDGSGVSLRTVGDLVDDLRDNAPGWKIGLGGFATTSEPDPVAILAGDYPHGSGRGRQHVVRWIDETDDEWRFTALSPTMRVLVDRGRPDDLAYHRSGALSALGDETSGYARLHFTLYGSALVRALRMLEGAWPDGTGAPAEALVPRRRCTTSKGSTAYGLVLAERSALADRISRAARMATFGLYAGVP